MNVLLVWQNDVVLGVFPDTARGRRAARRRMAKARRQNDSPWTCRPAYRENLDDEWYAYHYERWSSAGIARLTIETRVVWE